MSLNADFDAPPAAHAPAEPEFSPLGNGKPGGGVPLVAGEEGDAAAAGTEVDLSTTSPEEVGVSENGAGEGGGSGGGGGGGGEADAEGTAEDPEQTAFGNLFPREKLSNGLSQAKLLWSSGVQRVKEQADAVNGNPNVQKLKQRSSETWGVVVDKTQQGVTKVKEVTAPGVAKATEITAPMTAKVGQVAGKVGEVTAPVTQRVKEGALKTKDAIVEKTQQARESVKSEDFQFGRKSLGSALSSLGQKTSAGLATTRESMGVAGEKLRPGAERVSSEISSVSNRLRGSFAAFVSRPSTSSAAEGAGEAAEAPAAEAPEVPPPATPPAGPMNV